MNKILLLSAFAIIVLTHLANIKNSVDVVGHNNNCYVLFQDDEDDFNHYIGNTDSIKLFKKHYIFDTTSTLIPLCIASRPNSCAQIFTNDMMDYYNTSFIYPLCDVTQAMICSHDGGSRLTRLKSVLETWHEFRVINVYCQDWTYGKLLLATANQDSDVYCGLRYKTPSGQGHITSIHSISGDIVRVNEPRININMNTALEEGYSDFIYVFVKRIK
jgi:hypothetical protein